MALSPQRLRVFSPLFSNLFVAFCLWKGFYYFCPLFCYFSYYHEKINWKNYLSWSTSVELWFLGQVYHDHLKVNAVLNLDKF